MENISVNINLHMDQSINAVPNIKETYRAGDARQQIFTVKSLPFPPQHFSVFIYVCAYLYLKGLFHEMDWTFDFVNGCHLGLTESRDWFKVLDVLLIGPMGAMMYTFYISIHTKADKKEEKSIKAENIYLGVFFYEQGLKIFRQFLRTNKNYGLGGHI